MFFIGCVRVTIRIRMFRNTLRRRLCSTLLSLRVGLLCGLRFTVLLGCVPAVMELRTNLVT